MPQSTLIGKTNMTDDKARAILKKHAAIYGDTQYEPALWVIAAMKEAAETRLDLVGYAFSGTLDALSSMGGEGALLITQGPDEALGQDVALFRTKN